MLDLNETIPEGLAREVREETGVAIELEGLTGVYKNVVRGIVSLVFRCRALNEPVGATAEAREVRWLDPSEISEYMDEAYAVRLLDALREGPPLVRAHDGVALLTEGEQCRRTAGGLRRA